MGPFIKSKNNISKMMLHLFLSLCPIVIFSFIKNGIIPYSKGYTNIFGLFYPLIFIIVATVSSFAFDFLYNYLFLRGKNTISSVNSYSLLSGLLLGLVLPINASLIFVVIGAFVSSIITNILFSVFGKNILNPALVGKLLIIIAYAIFIDKSGLYLNTYELNSVSSTPLVNASMIDGIGSYETLVKPYGSLLNFFVGTVPGAVGETSVLLCLIAFAYLAYFKVIKWKIPVVYILTVFAITYVIGGMNDLGLWYPFFHIFSGGLIFGAIFLATDSVTSPVTPIGQILYGMFLGILTVVFRFLVPFTEGVLISILIMNMLVIVLDKVGSLARFDFKLSLVPFVFAWLLILGLSVGISINYNKKEKDINLDIISKENNVSFYVKEDYFV